MLMCVFTPCRRPTPRRCEVVMAQAGGEGPGDSAGLEADDPLDGLADRERPGREAEPDRPRTRAVVEVDTGSDRHPGPLEQGRRVCRRAAPATQLRSEVGVVVERPVG